MGACQVDRHTLYRCKCRLSVYFCGDKLSTDIGRPRCERLGQVAMPGSFLFCRWIELDQLYHLIQQAVQQRSLHPAKEVSVAMLGTTLLAVLAVNVLLISTTKKGRHLVSSFM